MRLSKFFNVLQRKFFAFFLLLPILYFGQNFRFKYSYTVVSDTIHKKNTYGDFYLDVDNTYAKFFYSSHFEVDSLKKKSISISTYNSQILKRKLGSWKNTNYVVAQGNYFSIESEDELNWTILQDKKEKKGYKLQKAITRFGGRNWVAWFCTDIPVNEGPYKFRGLPGLIFEVNDDKHYFKYSLYKIEKLKSVPNSTNYVETNFGKKPVSITYQEYNKLLLNEYYNPFTDMFGPGAGDFTLGYLGRILRNSNDVKEILPLHQKYVRESYNPIELDKAVQYPEK